MERDPWHYPRKSFAQLVINNYQAIRALTLYSPRRTGKTAFVLGDLVPSAIAANLTPIYVDLWSNQQNTARAIISMLRRSYVELTVADTRAGRTLQQPVERIQALGFGVTLGELPEPDEPDDDLSRIEYWFHKVLDASGRPVLLIVDEAQQIALDPQGDAVAGALRSVLQTQAHRLLAFFTGSSQHNLAAMFDDARAPFYQFGQQLRLPALERDFTDHVATCFETIATTLELDRDKLFAAFEALDCRPGPFREMTDGLLVANSDDIDAYLEQQKTDDRQRVELMLENRSLSIRETLVAARVAHGCEYASLRARQYYARYENKVKPLNAGLVDRAVKRLCEANIIDRGRGHGALRIASSALADLLRERFPDAKD